MILITALGQSDARLYEASRVLGSSGWRTFVTVTLPTARYGLLSAAIAVFTLTICDFGVAKVIGGQYSVLATDIYRQVIGMQNFSLGAVASCGICWRSVGARSGPCCFWHWWAWPFTAPWCSSGPTTSD